MGSVTSNVNCVVALSGHVACIRLLDIFLAKHWLLLVSLIVSKSSEDDPISTCISRDPCIVLQFRCFFLLIVHRPPLSCKLQSNFLFFARHSALVVVSRLTLNINHVFIVILSVVRSLLLLDSTLTDLIQRIHLRSSP